MVFKSLDADDSGSIDMNELLTLATGICPAMTEEECREMFKFLDSDGDAKVDESEYLQCMVMLTADIPQQEFDHGIRDLLARSDKMMDDPKYYFHCEGNRAYLEADVLPMVEQGLNALMVAVEAERLRVASGADWDEGYLPPDWRPLRPLQFLGEWLKANSKTGMAEKAEADALAEAQRRKEFNEMNRYEKLRHTFQAMDRDGSGANHLGRALMFLRRRLAQEEGAGGGRDGNGDGAAAWPAGLDPRADVESEEWRALMQRVCSEVNAAESSGPAAAAAASNNTSKL